MARHGLVQVRFGVDDLEESKRIFVDVDAAELSNIIGCISNKSHEVSAEVGMNLGGIYVGKVEGAWGNSSQGGNGAGTNTSIDMVEVFCGKKVVGLVWRNTRSVVAHNINERMKHNQHGGCAMMAMGQFSAKVVEAGVDHYGLGRWCWMRVGSGGKKT